LVDAPGFSYLIRNVRVRLNVPRQSRLEHPGEPAHIG
jgi:hypothetical protein